MSDDDKTIPLDREAMCLHYSGEEFGEPFACIRHPGHTGSHYYVSTSQFGPPPDRRRLCPECDGYGYGCPAPKRGPETVQCEYCRGSGLVEDDGEIVPPFEPEAA